MKNNSYVWTPAQAATSLPSSSLFGGVARSHAWHAHGFRLLACYLAARFARQKWIASPQANLTWSVNDIRKGGTWSRGANWRLLYKHGFSLTETRVEEYGEPKYGALALAGIGISRSGSTLFPGVFPTRRPNRLLVERTWERGCLGLSFFRLWRQWIP